MRKLVRDKMEEFLEDKGASIKYVKAEPHERPTLLFNKLIEELLEWVSASDRDARLKELGDLQEIIWAMGKSDNIESTEILQQAHGKQKARGGFDELIVMTVELESEEVESSRREKVLRDSGLINDGRPIGDGPWYSG